MQLAKSILSIFGSMSASTRPSLHHSLMISSNRTLFRRMRVLPSLALFPRMNVLFSCLPWIDPKKSQKCLAFPYSSLPITGISPKKSNISLVHPAVFSGSYISHMYLGFRCARERHMSSFLAAIGNLFEDKSMSSIVSFVKFGPCHA